MNYLITRKATPLDQQRLYYQGKKKPLNQFKFIKYLFVTSKENSSISNTTKRSFPFKFIKYLFVTSKENSSIGNTTKRKTTKYQPFCVELLSFLRLILSSSSSMELDVFAEFIISIKLWLFCRGALSYSLNICQLCIIQTLLAEEREDSDWLRRQERAGTAAMVWRQLCWLIRRPLSFL